MKIRIISKILALCSFSASVWVTTAFSVKAPKVSSVVLRSTSSETSAEQMFPLELAMEKIEGGKTVRTYPIPPWAERAQYVIKTNGRPLRAKVELWLGPIRRTHFMNLNLQDGSITPFRATLKFRKGPPLLKISTSSSLELPILACVAVPSPERAAELAAYTEKIWNTSPKTLIQGGRVEGGGGAIRTFPIDTDVDAVQVLFWSKDTGKKSFKVNIEILQGPNNTKQVYDLQCGGGSQPYHAVFETPGPGWIIRMTNKKFVEDGLVQAVVVPYNGDLGRDKADSSKRQWWE